MSQTPHSTDLTLSQLEQLCQPEQLESTLHLLFFMNHWAKARERLFFADRQGLYQVKAAVLQQAFAIGAIEATTYIDGTTDFGKDITLELAADIAAEAVTERLAGLSYPDPFMSDIHEKFKKNFIFILTILVNCQFQSFHPGAYVIALNVMQDEND